MTKNHIVFKCTVCHAEVKKWNGQCPNCEEWNSLESAEKDPTRPHQPAPKGGKLTIGPIGGEIEQEQRYPSGYSELDRVLGGGAVPGSFILLAGRPGVGKSTLLLQTAAHFSDAMKGQDCLYVGGEESPNQIRARAARLGLTDSALNITPDKSVDKIATYIMAEKPAMVVIDSIQTLYTEGSDSLPGSMAQIKAVGNILNEAIKQTNTILFCIGHVTKDGVIAGPQTLNHLVDVVLDIEYEDNSLFRIIRASKNRFGSIDEVGVFTMSQNGMESVDNPSQALLMERDGSAHGSVVYGGVEGTRPILLEIQALVTPTIGGNGRRNIIGYEPGRVAMILAALEAHCGLQFSEKDVFINIAGGMKIKDPAADLAIAAALISAISEVPAPRQSVWAGEIGLTGEVRSVFRTEARVKEAVNMGYQLIFLPHNKTQNASIIKKIRRVADIQDAVRTHIE